MKLAAGLMILFICGGWGLAQRIKLRRRCELLRELRLMLEQYSIKISCTAPTLEQLARESEGVFGSILWECAAETPDIRSAWSSSVQRLSALPCCGKEEAKMLAELGRALGTCPAESEISLLRLYSGQMDRLCDEAEKTSEQKGRLYSSGGILAGLAAAVLLL